MNNNRYQIYDLVRKKEEMGLYSNEQKMNHLSDGAIC